MIIKIFNNLISVEILFSSFTCESLFNHIIVLLILEPDSDRNRESCLLYTSLKEGWDCPFAYILATVANRTSSIDVEQILGRILRLPNTRKNKREVLNLSYVITSSNAFYATLDKVVAGLNAAGFTSKDYRIDDYVEQDTEFPVEQAGNIQTELKLDNDVTDDTNNVSDEIDSLNVDFVREQISPFVNNENMESQSQSKVNDAVTDMLDHAKTQNELYLSLIHILRLLVDICLKKKLMLKKRREIM